MTSPLPPGQLLSVARAFRPLHSSTGGLWFASDMPGFGQTYRLDGPDRFPVRLAPSQDRTLPIADTPLGLLVRQDHGGDETWQLALIESSGGGASLLTRDHRAIHREVHVAPGGRQAGVAYNPGGQADWVLGVIDLETGEIEDWLDRGGYWTWLGWSPDGRTAAVSSGHALRAHAFLLERGGEPRALLAGAPTVAQVTWAGGRLYARTDLDRDFVGLVEIDPQEPGRP